MITSLTQIPSVAAYLARIGAEPRSLRSAVVKQSFGNYWKDLAIIRFSKEGEAKCEDESYLPTTDEQALIKVECHGIVWPEQKKTKQIVNPHSLMAGAEEKNKFVFRDIEGDIVMVQIRVNKQGEKTYIPFTYWSDDQWRAMEPEGNLPLFNAEKLKDASTVFIHEGAKAADAVQKMIESFSPEDKRKLADHPWGRELMHAVHLGWVGGALSPRRTDWSAIGKAGINRCYIVADNDAPGRASVPRIAQQLEVPTFMIQFTDEFPASFDLADPFPEKMFGTVDGVKFYTGPSFRNCLHPATWATDLVQIGKGRPTAVLRDSFKNMWAYVEESDFFVCKEMPEIKRSEAILNKMLAPFSHVAETTRLIVKSYQGRSPRVCYRPDDLGLMVTFRGSSAINLHVPSTVRSQAGDPTPWFEFLEYMFVNEDERRDAMKWIATLIARPQIRMSFGMLLISERQGIGKSTLGNSILAPLVGMHNTGFPGESDINSDYNDWVALKRLAIIGEIYSGSNWKVYHKLKGLITDKEIMVNAKYERHYVVENWCHILACSNSMRALKVEQDDRRWFYPECAESPWPGEKFVKFRQWLETGGLSIIRNWAERFGVYFSPADRAPMTERKKEMIEGSRSEAQREAVALAEAAKSSVNPVGLSIKDVVGWCREQAQGRVHDSDYELKKAMCDVGMKALPKRIKVAGRLDYVVVNDHLFDQLRRTEDDRERNAIIRTHMRKCNEVMEAEF